MPRVRQYLSDNSFHITARDDLPETIESILGDSIGAGTLFDATRQHLSSYTWDHYGDLDPAAENNSLNSSIVQCLNAGLQLIDKAGDSPIMDVGCSVGRTTFELAKKYHKLTLGIDINFSMLRVAQNVLHNGEVNFPLRHIGIVYDRQKFNVQFEEREMVDFWACDALALPFIESSYGIATGFNVFDSVTSPRDLLASLEYILKPGGYAILATPYDWSPAATPIETWIGGHSQRGPDHGTPEKILRKLLAGDNPQSIKNLTIVGEIENHPWSVRVHSRSVTSYQTHIFALKKS
jgi:SAM-dependent methyltransferase